jgi:hypothetical protein
MVKGTWRKGYIPEVPDLEPRRVIRELGSIRQLLRERLG